MKKKNSFYTIIFYAALAAIIVFAVAALFMDTNPEEELTYSDVIGYFEDDKVKSFVVNESTITAIVIGDDGAEKEITYVFRDIGIFYNDFTALKENGGLQNLEKYDFPPLEERSWFWSYLPTIILIGVGVIFFLFVMRQSSGTGATKRGSFGKTKQRTPGPDGKRVLFSDVAGADEEKEELKEVVEYLRNPSKFTKLGAKIPHGVLLVGPPGTGKTLLAKAVAGEANVPFYSMSGSDFVELYVGVGASRVRDIFDTARKTPSAIIFIDEIDAVGRQRGAGLGGGHDEREQTLNQLLVEMDGFDGHSGTIVIAATNRPDILDSALLRPGRFDRQITVGYPDLQGREDILKVHSKDKPLEDTVDLRKIAQTTIGFTGADLANLLNEAAIMAARNGKSLIGMPEIEDAMIRVTVGTQKKSRKMSDKEKRNTAVHEAGHAILSHVLPTQDPVRQISIVPSGRALGYTLTPPTEDKYSESKGEMLERISMMLGGRVAERLVFGDYTGGASNDIMRATETARKMVTIYGMSDELGAIRFASDHADEGVFLGRDFSSTPNYSDATAAKIDAEIKKIIDGAYDLAVETLTKYRHKLDFVTEFLLEFEVMDDAQFALAMKEETTMDDLRALVEEKRRKSEEENRRREEQLAEQRRLAEEKRKELEKALGIYDGDDNDGNGVANTESNPENENKDGESKESEDDRGNDLHW
ncbi:MAG: ATP-dependent zinc metalloprotease FtsH [Clostridia bacterium]|nr:ATP-dependent zinc metalloprotease FtsH [Clostridia bacterium]